MPVTDRPPTSPRADGARAAPALTIPSGAASRSHAFLSGRLATREGSMGLFKPHDSGFQPSGFGPGKR
ncbi:MAG: hypothetical protein U1D29_10205 [Burkholderiales bacterium]|nr:hypothetical protein [Burkholderiales bacterium]